MPHAPRFLATCALALLAGWPGVARGGRVQVDIRGEHRDVVRLVDAETRAAIAVDLNAGEVLRDGIASSDDGVVAVRFGGQDDGDALSAYAIAWAIDPASGKRRGTVAQVLVYAPRDGRLSVSLETVPNGTLMQVQTGRHAPFWHKTFLRERASGRWYQWPRTLRAGYPMDGGTPATVGSARTADPYAAWLRAPIPDDGR
jgi:hypothetical protein